MSFESLPGHNVRIYVLHHRKNEQAHSIITAFYRWFRTKSKVGIAVYVRTDRTEPEYNYVSANDDGHPAMEKGSYIPIALPHSLHPNEEIRRQNQDALEYLVLLVDPHMVNSSQWREYINLLVHHETKHRQNLESADKFADCGKIVLLPVALDDSAFNLPNDLASRNMIRHDPKTGDIRRLLKDTTEAILQDITPRIYRDYTNFDKYRVFISYARADSDRVPNALRNYIQSSTQFNAFLDENDILYGRNFKEIIDDTLATQATAMFAVQGDSYADRPWCRYELQSFRYPRDITNAVFSEDDLDLLADRDIRLKTIMPIVTINCARGNTRLQ